MGLSMAEPWPEALEQGSGEDQDSGDIVAKRRQWYAVQVAPRHERKVFVRLEDKDMPVFLPLVSELHYWSDRRQRVEVPLFSGYTFVRLSPTMEERVAVLRTPGVVKLVGNGPLGTPIPDKQIEDISVLVNSRLSLEPYPFIEVGSRVRIRSGSMAGVEGILISKNSTDASLVVSVDLLRRSVAVRIQGLEVERIGGPAPRGRSFTLETLDPSNRRQTNARHRS